MTSFFEEEAALINAAVDEAAKRFTTVPVKARETLGKAAALYLRLQRESAFYPPAKQQKYELRKLRGHLTRAIDSLENVDPSFRSALDGLGRDDNGQLCRWDTHDVQSNMRQLREDIDRLLDLKFKNTKPVHEALEEAVRFLLVIFEGKYQIEILVREDKHGDGIHQLASPAAEAVCKLFSVIDPNLEFTTVAAMIVKVKRLTTPTPTVRNQFPD